MIQSLEAWHQAIIFDTISVNMTQNYNIW
jgi:hypothetical protein